ncbi:hypothetical protein ACWDV4_24100 [Micromonospora sp. NPDC003197]
MTTARVRGDLARPGDDAPPTSRYDESSGEETSMLPEMTNPQANPADKPVESERGALVAVLVMVLLGVAGIFAVSA